MTKPNHGPGLPRQLARLIDLRERELAQQQHLLAQHAQLCQRQAHSLARVQQLCQAVEGAAPAPQSSLLLNQAAYKDSLHALARAQEERLQAHEAERDWQGQHTLALARKAESLRLLQQRVVERVQAQQRRGEQRRNDEIASQLWLRREAV